MTSPGPAFQECTGSCHENVPTPKAVSYDLQSTDGLTVLARIEIVTILVHYQPSYNTSHTMKPSDPLLLANVTLLCRMYPAGKVDIAWHLAIPGFPQSDHTNCRQAQCVVKHSRPQLKTVLLCNNAIIGSKLRVKIWQAIFEIFKEYKKKNISFTCLCLFLGKT